MRFLRLFVLLFLVNASAGAQTTYLHVTFDDGTFSEWNAATYDSSGCTVPGVVANVSTAPNPVYNGAHSGAMRYSLCGVQTPAATTLSSTGASAFGARTYHVSYTYMSTACRNPWSGHQTYASTEQSLDVDANKLLNVASPATQIAIDRYMVYAGTVSGTRYLQTSTPATVAVDWTEPSSCPGGHTCISGTGLVNDTVTTPTSSDACPGGTVGGGGGNWHHIEAMPGLLHNFARGFVRYHKNDAASGDLYWAGCGKLNYFKSSDGSKWNTLVCMSSTGTYPANTWFAISIGNHYAPTGDETYVLNTLLTRAPYGCQFGNLSTCSSTAYHWLYDHWYYQELETKPNSVGPYIRDGEMRLWVQCMDCTPPDSAPILVAQIINANVRGEWTSALNEFGWGDQKDRYNYEAHDITKYWDEIVISSAYIGSSLATASLSPASVTFNNTNVGNTCPECPVPVTLTNNGTGTLNISSITITGAHAADFAITATTCGATLGAGLSCTIDTSFTPLALGLHTAAVTIVDDAPDTPQTVPLSGTGTGAPPAPAVWLSVSSLGFDPQKVGTTSLSQGITLYNSGDGTLNITSIVASGDFARTTTCGATLAAAASCDISVTFTPTAGGARTGAITLTTDAATSPDVGLLSGVGRTTLVLKDFRGHFAKP